MINLRYFASLRETLGVDNEQLELPDGVENVAALTQWLQTRGEPWHDALANPQLLVAVNQEVVSADTTVHNGDEIAWFPPVTGG